MILVDSDILIEVTRGRDREIGGLWEELSEAARVVTYSPVTAAELWHGARPHEYERPRRYRAAHRLFDALVCVSIDEEIGRLAGAYLAKYSRSHSLELGDALIAASAVVHCAELWTRNRKHFPMQEISFLQAPAR